MLHTSDPAEEVRSGGLCGPVSALEAAPRTVIASPAPHISSESSRSGLDPRRDATAATSRPPLSLAGPDGPRQSLLVGDSAAGTAEGDPQSDANAVSDGELISKQSPGVPNPCEAIPGASGCPVPMVPEVTQAEERLGEESPGQQSTLAAPEVSLAENGVEESSRRQESALIRPAASPVEDRVAEGPVSNIDSPVAPTSTPADGRLEDEDFEREGGREAADCSLADERLGKDVPGQKSSLVASEVSLSENRLAANTTREGILPTALEAAPAEERLAKDPLNRKSAYKEGLIAMLLSATSGKKGKRAAALAGKKA